ncbi:MAG: hypothetical protein A2289_23725 [Deltaproteobacteria bacterium RIFOXYA12_FULL_58_15]|nr:MAG: hypothetical protein A2289_23725 [Deltaproteobacteria bacterium RIFOXYA12_FULL_58_15]OGR08786.1 MAG: hypothetical protein A2341_10230 [Deltaproteobacteria bacterium RIFOXYB12_FULL_58_9]
MDESHGLPGDGDAAWSAGDLRITEDMPGDFRTTEEKVAFSAAGVSAPGLTLRVHAMDFAHSPTVWVDDGRLQTTAKYLWQTASHGFWILISKPINDGSTFEFAHHDTRQVLTILGHQINPRGILDRPIMEKALADCAARNADMRG